MTLALASTAGVVLGVGSTSDPLASLSWLVGWTLLGWAAVAGVAGVVGLLRRRAATPVEVGLLAAGLVVLVAVVAAHPPWGSGSGTA